MFNTKEVFFESKEAALDALEMLQTYAECDGFASVYDLYDLANYDNANHIDQIYIWPLVVFSKEISVMKHSNKGWIIDMPKPSLINMDFIGEVIDYEHYLKEESY